MSRSHEATIPTPPVARGARPARAVSDRSRPELVAGIDLLFQELTWRGRRHVARRVDAYGLTVQQYVALSAIGRQGPGVTMGDVGESLQLPASTVTSIVDRLVHNGLVERGVRPSDRRAVVATLTPAGESVVASVETARRSDLGVMLADLDEHALGLLELHLSRMLDALDQLTANPPQRDG
jgi:DNA-binding MarR family transcriptional regulator